MAGVRWKHKKTGNVYRIMAFGFTEKTLTPSVIYENVTQPGALFIRPCEEFFDGRFEMLGPTEESSDNMKPLDGVR